MRVFEAAFAQTPSALSFKIHASFCCTHAYHSAPALRETVHFTRAIHTQNTHTQQYTCKFLSLREMVDFTCTDNTHTHTNTLTAIHLQVPSIEIMHTLHTHTHTHIRIHIRIHLPQYTCKFLPLR